ncbi:hypothetical protein CSA80_04835 [Candidatus Saccharibacteria bacterium]|nr:MAG: hypothetical protein CSA80_04835 [Candidatus Saccharibacteria bacterium]
MAASKSPVKDMDVTHPDDTPAASSSRPVIVTNRPLLTSDPMLGPDEAKNADSERPSGAPPVKPSEALDGTSSLSREAKQLEPAEAASGTTSVEPQPKEKKAAKKTSSAPMPETAPEKPEVKTPNAKTAKQAEPLKPVAVATPAKEPKRPAGGIEITPVKHDKDEAIAQKNDEDAESTGQSGANEAQADAESEDEAPATEQEKAAEEDPEAAHNVMIERHISAGTYFVPIGQVKRRRRLAAVLAIVAVLAVVIVLNMLLDMGVFTIPNLPHTNFFQ